MGNTESVPTPAAPTTDVGKTCHDTVAKSLSRNEEYTSHVEFFTQAVLHHEHHLPDRVAVSWEYFVENKLWDIEFPTLLAFEESFAHTTELKGIVENSSRTRRRTAEEVKKVESVWGSIHEPPLKDVLPPHISHHLSRSLSKLAESVPLNDAIGPLREAVDDRRNGTRIPGKELPHVTNRDVEMVLERTTRTATVRSSQCGAVGAPVRTPISADTH
jgi:hypothetical protein